MLIAVDGNEANIQNKVGSGYYAYHLLTALEKYDKTNNYIIYLKNPPQPDMPQERAGWKYKVVGPKKFWTRLALPLTIYTSLPYPDLFFSPSHYSPPFLPCKKILSILDLGYLDTPEQFTPKDFYQLKNWTNSSIRTAAHFIAISEYTREDLVRRYNIAKEKIDVIYPIIKSPKKVNDKLVNRFILPQEKYLLFIGTLKPSKNVPYILSAFKKYLLNTNTKSTKLIIAGKKGWMYQDIFNIVTKEGLGDKVVFTDYLDEDTKWSLLKNAEVLLIPSLFEGFGIPAVEAFSVGTPVIASDRGSLNEILRNNGEIIDPNNSDSLYKALLNFNRAETVKKYSSHWSLILDKTSSKHCALMVINAFLSTKRYNN